MAANRRASRANCGTKPRVVETPSSNAGIPRKWPYHSGYSGMLWIASTPAVASIHHCAALCSVRNTCLAQIASGTSNSQAGVNQLATQDALGQGRCRQSLGSLAEPAVSGRQCPQM